MVVLRSARGARMVCWGGTRMSVLNVSGTGRQCCNVLHCQAPHALSYVLLYVLLYFPTCSRTFSWKRDARHMNASSTPPFCTRSSTWEGHAGRCRHLHHVHINTHIAACTNA